MARGPHDPRHARSPVRGRTGTKTAIFGLGCFWGDEKDFWQLPGVVTTAVGYAGGRTPNPTYEEACTGRTGHAEVVLVAFDPTRITYEQLLKTFWEDHDPTQGMRQGNDVGTQLPLDHPDRERRAAGGRRGLARCLPGHAVGQGGYGTITTEIVDAAPARSTTPRTTTSSTSTRTRAATARTTRPA